MHAELQIGDSLVMLGQAGGAFEPRAAAIYLWVEDVDATYDRAIAAGGTSESVPTDKPYGHRVGGVIDPNGVTWWIGSPLGPVTLRRPLRPSGPANGAKLRRDGTGSSPTAQESSMSRSVRRATMRLALGAGAALLLTAALVDAQLFKLTREQVVEITADNPFERFPDGRPKIPDALIEQAKGLSAEDVWAVLPGKNYRNQWADGFQLLHPGTKMAGRAFTAQFMPTRPDIMGALTANATKAGIASYTHQYALDQLQPGDVFVADVFGKGAEGTIVGDNLFYYVHKATRGGGIVVDGSVRDLEGLSDIPMPAYYRHAHPTPIREVMLTGINVPIRIGEATVSPGDLVLGDREGVYFIPPSLVQGILDRADETHIHDEWTKRKFDEGKYKSQEIYGSPRDPALKKEYEDYLAKKLAELKAQRAQKK